MGQLIVVTGKQGVGKTNKALELAKKYKFRRPYSLEKNPTKVIEFNGENILYIKNEIEDSLNQYLIVIVQDSIYDNFCSLLDDKTYFWRYDVNSEANGVIEVITSKDAIKSEEQTIEELHANHKQSDAEEFCKVMADSFKETSSISKENNPFSFDNFTKPSHYATGIDTFRRMEANKSLEQRMGFVYGNIDKYNDRTKGQDIEDLKKIMIYAAWGIKQISEELIEKEQQLYKKNPY